MEGSAWIRLYGGPELVTGQDSVAFTPIQACLVSLAYLEPRATLTRERITWLLWGLGEDAKTRQRIRQLLYMINSSSSQPVLERQGEAILPLLTSDASDLDPNDEPPLARITSPPTADFEQWMDRAVESLGNRRRRRLAQHLDELSEKGQWAGAATAAEALARLDPANRAWVEALVSLSVKARRPNTCLALLAELVAAGHLERDRFTALATRLQAMPPSWLPTPSKAARGPLVGRTREQTWLQAILGSSSGLGFVAIEGAGGIGKSRLLEEAGLDAIAKGARVAAIQLRHTTAAIPMAAVETLLAGLLRGHEPPQIPKPWAGVLGLEADLVECLEPLSNNRRFAEAVRIALATESAEGILLVALDDFQFADSTSLELLAEVNSTWRDSDCVFLLSIRHEPTDQSRSKLNGFLKHVQADRINLDALTGIESLELVNGMAPKNLSDAVRQEIVEIGRGNPQLLIDLSRSWEVGSEREYPPKSLQALVAEKIGRLGAMELEVLALVSAAPGIGSDRLESIIARSSWSVVETLDRLVAMELIEMSTGGYVFRHSLWREAAALELGPVREREAHLRIARHLAQRSASAPSEIVHHFREGGASAEALRWAVEAARQARKVGALAQAMDFYDVALESAHGRDDPELLAEAGKTCLLLCRRTEGIVLLKKAEEFGAPAAVSSWAIARLDAQSEAGQISHPDASSRLSRIASDCASRGDWTSSLAATETAIRVLERAGDWRGIQHLLGAARASAGMGGPTAEIRRHMILALGMVYGEVGTASESARHAFRMAFQSDATDETRARAAHRLFIVLLSEGTVETPLGRQCLEVLKARAAATGDLKLHYTTLANQAVWYLDTDALDEAGFLLEEAALVVSGSHATNERQNLATNRGDLLLRQQRPEEALRSFELARDLIEPGTRGFLADIAIAGAGLSKLRLGQFQAAERLSSEMGYYDHYYFDASLMIRLRVELMRHRRRTAEALEYLSTERGMLRDSFVPQYLSLTLWEGQLRRRERDSTFQTLFLEVSERAEDLGIRRLATRARAVAGVSST